MPGGAGGGTNGTGGGSGEQSEIEITADILKQKDPMTGGPFVDIVLDMALGTRFADFRRDVHNVVHALRTRRVSSLRQRVDALADLRGHLERDLAREAFRHNCGRGSMGYQIHDIADKASSWASCN